MKPSATLAGLLERFFTQRLMQQRQASPHTISSYRDTFRLFLRFAHQQLHVPPARLAFTAIDAPLVAAFLVDLEQQRGITARSRNLRLTAIRSFFRDAAYEEPAHAAQIQRVLAIPAKRHTRRVISFLTRAEVAALLAAPRSAHLARPPRSRLAAGGPANRLARFRVNEPPARGRGVRGRRPCALCGERPQGAVHPAD